MRDGIIYDCPSVNCKTPIYTGKCRKDCLEKRNKELGINHHTNADRIRAMSDEELAAWLARIANGDVYTDFCDNPARTIVCDSKCVGCIAEWLKQFVKDGDNDG